MVQQKVKRVLSWCAAISALWLGLGGGMQTAAAESVSLRDVAANRNPCALFYSLRKNNSVDVVKVEVLGQENGLVGVMILGIPNKVNVTLNGLDVSRQKTHSQQIICGKEAIGEFRAYDVRSLNMDAGYFQVYAGGFTVGKSLKFK